MNDCTTRRAFLRDGTLLLTAGAASFSSVSQLFADDAAAKPKVRAALVTDLHYADKPKNGTRYYRETLGKLAEATGHFKKVKPEFVVELGDFVDAAATVKTELGYLKTIRKAFDDIPGDKYAVLGNHCVQTLTKQEFLDGFGQKKSYYSFDKGGYHFIVLDSCFRSDGKPYGRKNFKWTDPNIPADQVEWLLADLKKSGRKTVVFAHQRLDVSNQYGVKNAKDVRKVLEDSRNVLAVFQGHSHKNDLRRVNGIPYCTLVAMVEGSGEKNNAYSVMDILDEGTIRITGFRQQKNYDWPSRKASR